MPNPPAPAHWSSEFLGLIGQSIGLFTMAELALAGVVAVLAMARPGLGSPAFGRLEQRGAAWAADPLRAILTVGVLAFAGRALLLPWVGSSAPYVHDEQSMVLQAQTFLAGRLANPTHPLWPHFETFYVNHLPAYASMYFPGRGAPLAVGLWLAGDPWLGVWLSMMALCMAATWMLQAWVSAPLALLGGVLVVVRVGLFSNWINGLNGGAFAALGAMLVVGAVPRLLQAPRWRHGLVLGTGTVIVMTTRPYEGFLLCLPFAALVLWRLVRPAAGALGRGPLAWEGVAPAAVLIAAGAGLLLAHNQATTGDALQTPWSLHRQLYGGAPGFLFQPPLPERTDAPLHVRAYYASEARYHSHGDSLPQLARSVAAKLLHTWNFYIGPIFTFALLAGLWCCRRHVLLLATLGIFFAGYVLETFNFPQYTAPLYPVLLILLMKGFAWLRTWAPQGRPVGLFLSRAMPAAAVALLALPLLSATAGWPAVGARSQTPCCVLGTFELKRSLEQRLRDSPGRDLVIVEDGPHNPPFVDLVYNEPDVDRAEIVWARTLGPQRDAALREYFRNRQAWLFRWTGDADPGWEFRQAPAPRPHAPSP